MYRIPLLDGFILVDCSWQSYDPDRFEIYSMEWEVGITIPDYVYFNLEIDDPDLVEWQTPREIYIHEYIFSWMCRNIVVEYPGER